MRRPPGRLLLALLVLGPTTGCSVPELRGSTVRDEELVADGTWTERDARARQLLDLAAPPEQAGQWPVRLPPVRRKLLTETSAFFLPRVRVDLLRPDWEDVSVEDLGAVVGVLGQERAGLLESAEVFFSSWAGTFTLGVLDAVLGQDHEARYTYVAEAEAWVVLARDGSPCVIADDPGRDVVLPGEDTPPRAFPALRRELERDVARLMALPVTPAARAGDDDLALPPGRRQSGGRGPNERPRRLAAHRRLRVRTRRDRH